MTMSQDSVFSNYTQLLDKVDQMFATTKSRHAESFRCGAGCYGCCKAGLSIANVEAVRIRAWLLEHPAVMERLKTRQGLLNDAQYCQFLSRVGHCMIYDVRPLICRSHGMPIAWVQADQESRDCCPLNFQNRDLAALESSDVLSLDKVNTLLSLIDRHFDAEQAGARIPMETLLDDGS